MQKPATKLAPTAAAKHELSGEKDKLSTGASLEDSIKLQVRWIYKWVYMFQQEIKI